MSGAMKKLIARGAGIKPTVEREIKVPLDKIRFDPTQPRKAFHSIDGRVDAKDEQYIAELAESIKQQDLIQAITVQEMPDGTYLVVVGECRTRAHLLLNLPTIRAIVRNDLMTPSSRLLYQLSENVNRQDLTENEMAISIKILLQGTDNNAPLTQAQIARNLGKSEGWVSKYVRFSDEELQRVWVKTGIANTVENIYRISVLPKWLQIELLRRVGLPEDDPEFIETPITREVVNHFSDLSKREKLRHKQAETLSPSDEGAGNELPNSPPRDIDTIVTDGSSSALDEDPIALAFAQAAQSGQESVSSPSLVSAQTSNAYRLSDEERVALISKREPESFPAHGSESRLTAAPPIKCRASVRNMEALLLRLNSDQSMLDSARDVFCELSIPNELAKLIANKLVGVVVDDQEIQAIMQVELQKLG